MLITGKKITEGNPPKNGKLLKNTVNDSLKGGCYYLRIHSIIPAGDEAKKYDAKKPKLFHNLEPGGLAWVISQEEFTIKETSITALVTLRSSFTKKGLLALDVGLVDANFFGPIGTLVINFSNQCIRLDEGEMFFRVVFFEHDAADESHVPPVVNKTHVEYVQDILSTKIGWFSSTFLQTSELGDRVRDSIKADLIEKLEPELLDKIAARFLSKNLRKLVSLVIIVLVFFIAGTYLSGVSGYLHTKDQIQDIVNDRLEILEEENQAQSAIIERLEALEEINE
jgi:deoxycytidine triphosphate deaminase